MNVVVVVVLEGTFPGPSGESTRGLETAPFIISGFDKSRNLCIWTCRGFHVSWPHRGETWWPPDPRPISPSTTPPRSVDIKRRPHRTLAVVVTFYAPCVRQHCHTFHIYFKWPKDAYKIAFSDSQPPAKLPIFFHSFFLWEEILNCCLGYTQYLCNSSDHFFLPLTLRRERERAIFNISDWSIACKNKNKTPIIVTSEIRAGPHRCVDWGCWISPHSTQTYHKREAESRKCGSCHELPHLQVSGWASFQCGGIFLISC